MTYGYTHAAAGSSSVQGNPYSPGSGHFAGFEWAKAKGITDESEAGGQSSFREGCLAYIAQQKQTDNGADGEPVDDSTLDGSEIS